MSARVYTYLSNFKYLEKSTFIYLIIEILRKLITRLMKFQDVSHNKKFIYIIFLNHLKMFTISKKREILSTIAIYSQKIPTNVEIISNN